MNQREAETRATERAAYRDREFERDRERVGVALVGVMTASDQLLRDLYAAAHLDTTELSPRIIVADFDGSLWRRVRAAVGA